MTQQVFGTQALVFLLERDSWLRHKGNRLKISEPQPEIERCLQSFQQQHDAGEAGLEITFTEHSIAQTTYKQLPHRSI